MPMRWLIIKALEAHSSMSAHATVCLLMQLLLVPKYRFWWWLHCCIHCSMPYNGCLGGAIRYHWYVKQEHSFACTPRRSRAAAAAATHAAARTATQLAATHTTASQLQQQKYHYPHYQNCGIKHNQSNSISATVNFYLSKSVACE